MTLHTNMLPTHARELLVQLGVEDPSGLMDRARDAEAGTWVFALPRPAEAVHVVFTRPPLMAYQGTAHYTVDACQDHDDSSGCCDVCGRWAAKDDANVARQANQDEV